MADKDYKVQVGVEAKADTRGLDQVNKGLDKVRRTAKQVNDELDDNAVRKCARLQSGRGDGCR